MNCLRAMLSMKSYFSSQSSLYIGELKLEGLSGRWIKIITHRESYLILCDTVPSKNSDASPC